MPKAFLIIHIGITKGRRAEYVGAKSILSRMSGGINTLFLAMRLKMHTSHNGRVLLNPDKIPTIY
jgi:hypothetical protein